MSRKSDRLKTLPQELFQLDKGKAALLVMSMTIEHTISGLVCGAAPCRLHPGLPTLKASAPGTWTQACADRPHLPSPTS